MLSFTRVSKICDPSPLRIFYSNSLLHSPLDSPMHVSIHPSIHSSSRLKLHHPDHNQSIVSTSRLSSVYFYFLSLLKNKTKEKPKTPSLSSPPPPTLSHFPSSQKQKKKKQAQSKAPTFSSALYTTPDAHTPCTGWDPPSSAALSSCSPRRGIASELMTSRQRQWWW